MSDDTQTEQNNSKAVEPQKLEIEATETDGQTAETKETEAKEAPAEKELSPEEQKKLAAEAQKAKAQEELDTIRKELHSGDMVKVYTKVKEGDKERIQAFQGMVISKRGAGQSKTFTVRKIAADSVGVERIWPVLSPSIVKIEMIKKSKVRRSKLYFLRKRIGKAAMDLSR